MTKEEQEEKLEDCEVVYGLFLEAAQFSYETMEIEDTQGKQLINKCPHIALKPTTDSKQGGAMFYECPLYKTMDRRGVLSTTGHSTNFVITVNLPSKENPQFWIKRGVALFTMTNE